MINNEESANFVLNRFYYFSIRVINKNKQIDLTCRFLLLYFYLNQIMLNNAQLEQYIRINYSLNKCCSVWKISNLVQIIYLLIAISLNDPIIQIGIFYKIANSEIEKKFDQLRESG